jgi:hypothetical protein
MSSVIPYYHVLFIRETLENLAFVLEQLYSLPLHFLTSDGDPYHPEPGWEDKLMSATYHLIKSCYLAAADRQETSELTPRSRFTQALSAIEIDLISYAWASVTEALGPLGMKYIGRRLYVYDGNIEFFNRRMGGSFEDGLASSLPRSEFELSSGSETLIGSGRLYKRHRSESSQDYTTKCRTCKDRFESPEELLVHLRQKRHGHLGGKQLRWKRRLEREVSMVSTTVEQSEQWFG